MRTLKAVSKDLAEAELLWENATVHNEWLAARTKVYKLMDEYDAVVAAKKSS